MKNLVTKIIFFIVISFLFACSKSEYLEASKISIIETGLGIKSSDSPFEEDFLFFKDVRYGINDRNILDIILPKKNKLVGAVIFFHGGAFLFGSKEDLYEGDQKQIINSILNENLAVINSEYTFITDDEAEGVITSLIDGRKVIEFITQKSNLLGFPENKLILSGISAGAGIAIWNGLREESNKNIIGIFTTLAQSTYDMYKWEKIFPDFEVDILRSKYTELDDLFLKFYNNSINSENLKVLDYLNQMDKDDPPIFIYNPVYEDQVITKNNIIDFNILFHSYKHGNAIRKAATDVGLQFSGPYQETPISFIRRMIFK
tara:strand:- start:1632 stop:2582 length:951 start_codon:yes stop_codon:yes gene_type:complete